MKLFGNDLNLIILKLSGEGKCVTSCVGCDESLKEATIGYDFEGIKKIILYSLKELVIERSRFFLYGKNIFVLSYYDELINFIKSNPQINFDFHLTTILEKDDFKKIEELLQIKNITFTFCQSYITIDFSILEKIIYILGKDSKRHQIVFIAEKDFNNIKEYFDNINTKGNFELTISKYPIFTSSSVLGTGLKKCVVLNNFIPRENYIEINGSMLLEILVNGDLRLHNYLCNLASIDITNIYKSREDIIKDIKKFIYFFHKFHSIGNFEENCYKCIKKINYSYRKIS